MRPIFKATCHYGKLRFYPVNQSAIGLTLIRRSKTLDLENLYTLQEAGILSIIRLHDESLTESSLKEIDEFLIKQSRIPESNQ